MDQVIGVRFRNNKKIYYFSTTDNGLKEGDGVIVDTSRGVEYAQVVMEPFDLKEEEFTYALKSVIRKATFEDQQVYQENIERSKEAHEICKDKIYDHNLDMKLLDTEYNFDNSKLIFHFASENRVDFRNLVRDLASVFRTRIELRQVGVRDEARYTGALGSCGRETCCSSFLCEFKPVTINMAKDQSFSLNPSKISGMCGRLMCCLAYEQETYTYILEKMPNMGENVMTPIGQGIVTQISPLQEVIRVRVRTEEGTIEENFDLSELD